MSSLELVTYRSFTSSLLALQLFPLDCQHLPLLSLFPGAHASAVRTYKEGRSRSVSVLELALDTVLPLTDDTYLSSLDLKTSSSREIESHFENLTAMGESVKVLILDYVYNYLLAYIS